MSSPMMDRSSAGPSEGVTREEMHAPVANAKDGHLEHPGATRLFAAAPVLRNVPVLGIALEAFGPSLVFSVGGFYFMNNGLAENIIALSRQAMLMKRYGIDGMRYQRLAGIITMGSSLKVLMAILSDTVVIFHYKKRWYQLGSCVLGFAFCLGYFLLPAQSSSADPAAAFIFLCTFFRMNADILTQGHYSRLLRRIPTAGPALIGWIYWMVSIAVIVASVLVGPLSDRNKQQYAVLVSAIMHLLPAIIFILNGYGEKTSDEERREDAILNAADYAKARGLQPSSSLPAKEAALGLEEEEVMVLHDGLSSEGGEEAIHDGIVAKSVLHLDEDDDDVVLDDEIILEPLPSCLCGLIEVNVSTLRHNWKIVLYSGIMVASVITLACVTILGTIWDLLYASCAVSVACIGCAYFTLPRIVAKAQTFVYLDFVLYIALPGAIDNFYLADSACNPGGPNFSYTFYNTVGAVIQNIAAMVGVVLFTYVFSKMRYQTCFIFTVTLRVLASVFDLIVVQRWNIYIGIPDHAMYICGDSIVYQVCYMVGYMPMVMLLSRVVPRGSESMVYALMSSIGNLGMTMSNTVGSLLMELAWPVITDVPCDFSNVKWLIITGHLATPLLVIPLSFLLLPMVRICDDIDVNGKAIKKQVEKEKKAAEESSSTAEPFSAAEDDKVPPRA